MRSPAIHLGLVALLALGFVDNTFSACCCRVPAAMEKSHGCCSAPDPDEGCCHGEGKCRGLLGRPCREKGPQQSGPDAPDVLPAMDLGICLMPASSSVAVTEFSPLRTDCHGPPIFILSASLRI